MSAPAALSRLEEIIDASGIAPDRGAAADRGAAPPAAGPHSAGRDAAVPGRSPARAPDPGPRRADRPAGRRPGPARRDRGLEGRPAPAHLPADRTHLRPGRRRPGQGGPRRPALGDPRGDLRRPAGGGSIPEEHRQASTALAVDWTDVETFSRPPPHGTSDCADPEASWGHRKGGGPGQDSELFFGYYASAGTMMRAEHGPAMPELARRMTVCSCHADPARALVPVLTRMPGDGIPLGDILADSGYAHRDATAWAIPLRLAGARLVQDLHPSDRGPKGNHHGAIIANGNLYCPATPGRCPNSAPSPGTPPRPNSRARHPVRRTGPLQARADHQRRPRRLPPGDVPCHHGQDPLPATPGLNDAGPAAAGNPHPARAPAGLLRPGDPHGPTPDRAKTTQKHDYPSAAHRQSSPGAPAPSGPLHRQGPRQQQHRPRLDPADGPDPADALARLPARHPQPADPHRLGRPPGRQRPPRRRGAATPDPPPRPKTLTNLATAGTPP